MPCSHCNKAGHNIRTCVLKNNHIHMDGAFEINKKTRLTPKGMELLTALQRNNFNKVHEILQDAFLSEKKLKEKITNLEEINAKLYQNNEVIKSKFDTEKRKRQEDIGTIIIDRCKFRSAMLILKDRNINKTTAAEPQNIPFDCPVCFEKKYTGIECNNGHKLCSSCSYENLWFSNQTCPCCRIPYQNKSIIDICNKSGIEIGMNDEGERTVKMTNLIKLVTRDMHEEGVNIDIQFL